MKGKTGNDIIEMTTTWPSKISDKMIFLRKEWSISSQLMIQEGTFQSIFVLSTSISLSDYDSITLNIGVIRYNDQQKTYTFNTITIIRIFVWVVHQ